MLLHVLIINPRGSCAFIWRAFSSQVVHALLMAIQSTFDLEPEEPQKRYEKNGRAMAIILVQKSSKSAQ